MSEPVIRLANVGRSFVVPHGQVVAVEEASLALFAGEVTALVGPSGSGKTTLLNIIIDADQPDTGTVERGSEVAGTWDQTAFVPQDLGLLAELSIRENVGLATRFGVASHEAISQVLDQFGLQDVASRVPDEVSMGEQQRAAVARAVIAQPRLLAADEPTAHQDEANAMMIMGQLRDLAKRGSAILVATHEARILEKVDRVITMADGRLLPQ